jgi:hypothetical protein
MSRAPEDLLRDLLRTRAGDVSPATDWEDRVLVAGKRRRRNRRIGVGMAAVATVALVAIGVNVVASPFAADDPDIAKTPKSNVSATADSRPVPSQDGAPTAWKALPRGPQTQLPYAYGKRLATSLVTTGEVPDRFIGLAEYGAGAVLVLRRDDLAEMNDDVRLMIGDRLPKIPPPTQRDDDNEYIGGGSNISPVIVSASGRYIAYTSRPTQGNNQPVAQVIDLTAGTTYLDFEGPNDMATLGVPDYLSENEEFTQSIAFLGDDLVVSARNQAYLWKRGQEEPQPWLIGGRRIEWFHGVSQQAGIALVGDGTTACVTALNLTDGTERWKKCEPTVGAEFSPDGKVLAGAQGDTIVFRSAATGDVVKTARVAGLTIGQLVWEKSAEVLAVVSDDKDSEPAMIRCGSDTGKCEGVPSLLAGKRDSPLVIARRASK